MIYCIIIETNNSAHLQSEAQSVLYINRSDVELIKEEGHEGCGFYPSGFFNDWSKKSYDALQVRIIGPTLGLAKGMLLKKTGIKKIQLPSSMIKAPKSRTCNDNWLAVVIKNVFPSQENVQMGRLLDPDAQQATDSWKEQARKQLSPMYARMLIGFGVKKRVVDTYTRRSRNTKTLKHGTNFAFYSVTSMLPNAFNSLFTVIIKHTKKDASTPLVLSRKIEYSFLVI